MAPVAKPVGAKKPRGSVLFYDGEKEKGPGRNRRPKDDSAISNDTSPQKRVQNSVQPSSGPSSAKKPLLNKPMGFTHRFKISSSLARPLENTSGSSFSLPTVTPARPKSSPTQPLISPSYSNKQVNKPINLDLRISANAQVVLSLTKDVLEAFSEVPYVKIVVGVALKIIEISDEIKAYKESCSELIDKVLSFSQAVFEALLTLEGKDSLHISGIKDDLTQINTVFESVYTFLNNIKKPDPRSRLRNVVNRDEILRRISEQDRRLDNAITMFQFKSTIKLRKGVETSSATQILQGSGGNVSRPSRNTFTHRPRPQIFIGRNSEVQVISSYIQDCNRLPTRLCILGPGGIGKTSLALTIFHLDIICAMFKEDRYFISCEATPSADLLLAELAATFAISIEGDILKTLLLHLQKNPCLLVLDNFETVWDPSEGRSQVESLLTEITSIDTVVLIVTMRGSQRPTGTLWSEIIPPLKPIDIDSAVAIFQAISHKSDEYARRLVKAVDCMPLAVTLLATLASVDGENTEGLWIRWQQENTSMVEQGGGRLNNLEKSIELSISGPRMQSDRGALIFLGILSMLPDGMSSDTMKVCEAYFPDGVMVHKAVSTLRQNALIYEDTARNIRVLNPIRLFINKQYRASKKAQLFLHGIFISLALQGASYTNPSIRSRLEKENGNINAILLQALETATAQELTEVVQATINFSHYAYVCGKGSIQTISLAIDKLETSSNQPDVHMSDQMEVLGVSKKTSRRGLRILQIPVPYFKRSGRTQPGKDEWEASGIASALKLRADCLGCLGQILSQQSKYIYAEEKFRLAMSLHIQAGDAGGYAYDTLNLGLLMSQNENSSENALELFKQAVVLHEQTGDLSGKAYDLLAAGGTLRELYRFGESETMFSEAARIFTDLDEISGQATAFHGLGTVMLCQTRLPDAENHFRNAAILSAQVGDIIGQAESVSALAVILLLLSRLAEAKTKIEQSISLRYPYEDPDYLHILGRIYIGKEDWNQAERCLSQALALHQEIGNSRGEADDLCYLASVHYSRGNLLITQNLACRALVKDAGKATTAQLKALFSLILIYRSLFHIAKRELEWSLAVYEEIEDVMGQAHIFYLTGIYHVRLGAFEEAMVNLERALELHTQVGHLKGQADVLRLMAYILAVQDLLPQALATAEKGIRIHIAIENKSGHGSGLYVQAMVFLSQHRYEDAHKAINSALKLHEASESKYGKARDLVLLSNILWFQQHQQSPTGTPLPVDGAQPYSTPSKEDIIADAISYLEESIKLFKYLGCFREMDNCIEQKRQMTISRVDWKPSPRIY